MKIAAVVAVRKNSERCKNKMLRPFADTTLVDLSLERLSILEGFDAKYFAAHEDEFLEKPSHPSVSVLKRSHESANTEVPTKVHEYLAGVSEDFIMFINACNPFLSAETIDKAVNLFRENRFRTMTSVVKNKNWFYTHDGKPINNLDPANLSTKTTPPLYEVIHAFHIINKKYFLDNGYYWLNKVDDPHLFEIPEEENYDIDTEWDFAISEKLYQEKNRTA